MHEASLIQDMMDQVRGVKSAHDIQTVAEILIEIGPLSGVEPLLVEQSFQWLVGGTEFERTRLTIIPVPLLATCRDCRHEFEVLDFFFCCSQCNSYQVQVTSGDQVRLVSITADSNSAPCPLSK